MENPIKIEEVHCKDNDGYSSQDLSYIQIKIDGEIIDSDGFGTLEEFIQYISNISFDCGLRGIE